MNTIDTTETPTFSALIACLAAMLGANENVALECLDEERARIEWEGVTTRAQYFKASRKGSEYQLNRRGQALVWRLIEIESA